MMIMHVEDLSSEPPAHNQASQLTQLCREYVFLRSLAVSGLILAMVITYSALEFKIPVLPIGLVICALSIFSMFSWRQLGKGTDAWQRLFLIQLLVDLAALTVLLYFTGGSTNPFVTLLLLPVTVAAATLHPRYTWLVAASGALGYTVLMFIYVPMPKWEHTADHDFSLHIWGMWLGFLLSASLVAYFVVRIGTALRTHERALATAREQALEASRLVALGTLATGTAHELGTPLGTMAILTKELQHDHDSDPVLIEQLKLLRGQIDRCKEILSRMAANAGQIQARSGHRISVDRLLPDLITEWRVSRPEVMLNLDQSGPDPAPRIVAERTLEQAIINVLNNAADASQAPIEVNCHWDSACLRIEIRDYGTGLDQAVRGRIGEAFVTTKAPGTGMGLGLYLARSTLTRFGGTLSLHDHSDAGSDGERGVTASIVLPLRQVLASR